MVKLSLLPADTYIVLNKTILHDYDRRLLSMLYQPIIGAESVNFYFTLWSYLDKNDLMSSEWTHHHLMAAMRVSLDIIYEAREKLEAIGLIRTYFKKGNVNSYVYELYSPLDASDFFKDPILGNSLKQNIGETEFNRTLDYFKLLKINYEGYSEVTNSFTDVFKISLDSNYDLIEGEIKKRNKNKLNLKTKIKLSEVISLIPEELFNPRSITNEMRDLIYRLALIYDLNNDQMRDLIKNSVDDRRMINSEMLRDNAQNYFKFEHKGKLPTVAYQNQPDFLKSKLDNVSNQSKMIYTFESTSPHDFLASKNVNGRITNTDKEVLSYLMIDLKLNPGVVNVLLDYVLRINNNKLNKKFVETIASQWIKSNIQNAEDALTLAKREYTERSKVKSKKESGNKKTENIPSWYKKEITSDNISNEDMSSISKLLDQYK